MFGSRCAFDWGVENCWLVPPIYLIPCVLIHFLNCKSRGVLLVPFWPLSLFWPFLIQGNGAFESFVVDLLFVQNGRDVFVRGGNKETVLAPPHDFEAKGDSTLTTHSHNTLRVS